jgi:tRNA-splicing ligase RtcB
MSDEALKRVDNNIWEISTDYKVGMNVPARVLSSSSLIDGIDKKVIDQITNVACLPGIKKYAYCMPDGHMGYGFPIGGVAAFSKNEGIISPGGIGFDINCGMRLIRTDLVYDDLKPYAEKLLNRLFRTIPSGVGSSGFLKLDRSQFRQIMERGVDWCLENGYATDEDVELIEDKGCLKGADHKTVSDKAISRGIKQMGTLGSGNHYLEVEITSPENIEDKNIAKIFGVDRDNQVLVAVHCGSRGFGHQIATDYLQVFARYRDKYKLEIRDKELMSAPISSDEGKEYFSAMACAANAAFVNRQLIVYGIRKAFREVFGKNDEALGLSTIYDVAHNIAKFEEYEIDGKTETVLVHRKGATRSFGPGRKDLPDKYREVGQPVIVGGSMQTGSALLCGTAVADAETFGSSLHGAGRTMSRFKAKKKTRGDAIKQSMKENGILVKTGYMPGLAEEAGFAYKNIDDVVEAVDRIGISKKVARFYPVLNIKG